MSSNSQIERSSSTTKMLPTRCSSRGQRSSDRFRYGGCFTRGGLLQTPQTDHEAGALADFRPRPHLALMRLYDLVHDGETESGTAFEVRLEGLEDFFRLLRLDAGTGVGKAHFPVGAALGESDGDDSSLIRRLDCAHRIFAEVPKHLFELVAIGQHPGFRLREVALEFDARALGGEAVLEQSERVLEQWNQIYALEFILLAAGVGQEIGDDVIEAVGLAGHNLEKMALFRIQRGHIRQHADRAGNRGQGIADFVSDGSSQTADGGQAILHAYFAFEAADLGEVVKGIDKAQVFRRAHVEGGDQDSKRLAEAVSGQVADFGIGPGDAEVGQRVLKNLGHGASAQLGFGDSEQLLGGAIDQRDAPVNPGGDDTSAHGLHDIFVEGLQILERPARILQLHIRLAKLAYQQTGKVSDGKVGKQVDEDYYLQRLQLGMGVRIRGHDAVIIEFEDGTEQDESQGGTEISPGSRQEHASDNDDQGVEKIQRAVDAAGDMNHQRDHGQIGEHLENGLEAVLAPDRNQKKEKQRKHEPEHHPDEEGQDGQRAGRKPDDGEFDGEQNQQDQD